MSTLTGYDVVVVGYGAAGVAAAIEAADAGARVLALDRGYGGGSAVLSGGVVYAGGGTRYQRAAGLSDTPENMFAYLRQETRGVVSEATLRRFCEQSPAMIDWLEAQGARFEGTLCPYLTSYPTDAYYLYYSGNELAYPYREHAAPAARGHRQVAKGLRSGRALFGALRDSAMRKGVCFRPLSRVTALIIEDGAVVGVRFRTADPDADPIRAHRRTAAVAAKLRNWVPALGVRLEERVESMWWQNSTEAEARALAVILAGGGHAANPQLRAAAGGEVGAGVQAAALAGSANLGTAGDDGSAIALGISAGGAATQLSRLAAWRFLSPPAALVRGVSVGPSGHRIANEDLYGATHAEIMITKHGGAGYLILDARIWRDARRHILSQTQAFQAAQAAYLFTVGHKRADTIEHLASKIGVPGGVLAETIRAYNDGITSGAGDPAHKAPELCAPITQAPFYAIDISIKNARLCPAPVMTLGGLQVDEVTGHVLSAAGAAIPGLYAAGRTATGICSNSYISGLSLADCFFSGRRAGAHAATQAAT